MTSTQLKRLNNYPEFRTDAGINDIINFIRNGNHPPNLNQRQTNRYDEKYGPNSGFVIINDRLHYRPNNEINLEVVRPNQRLNRIQLVYNDITRGIGKGLNSFYHEVCSTYLNIPKIMTDDFLRSQGNYAVAKTPQKTLVNKPVLTKVPNERWAVDLIDMETFDIPAVNANRKYIMTVIDHFSGKVWARGLVNRENNQNVSTLSNAIQNICQTANTVPHIIQGDGEFAVGAFRQWCQNNNIRFVQATPFTPTSNGKVERMNREIRRKIRANMIRNNNFQWFQDLQPLIENINRQVKSRNGLSANQLWRQGYNPHPAGRIAPALQPVNDNFNIQQRQDYQEAFLRDQAIQLLAQGRPPRVFNNGDLVRIKMTTASNVMREARKSQIGYNKVSIHYTTQIFRVRRAFQYPPNALQRDQYVLENLQGEILMQGANPRRFFGNDLILVPPQNVQTNVAPQNILRTLQFNRFA